MGEHRASLLSGLRWQWQSLWMPWLPCLSSELPHMVEFYPQIKLLHVSTVLLSGGIFLVRGLLILRGATWGSHYLLKWASYINDSILLTAGLLLMQITRQYPLTHDWLSVKLSLLVVYIGLGILAFRDGRGRGQRGIFFVAALSVYLFMLSVARHHHPLGVFVNFPVL